MSLDSSPILHAHAGWIYTGVLFGISAVAVVIVAHVISLVRYLIVASDYYNNLDYDGMNAYLQQTHNTRHA